jgi:hypothetical protein
VQSRMPVYQSGSKPRRLGVAVGAEGHARVVGCLHRHPSIGAWVRRAMIMADGKRVTVRDLELTDTLSALPPQTLKEARETVEREMVKEALRRHMGKITATALWNSA